VHHEVQRLQGILASLPTTLEEDQALLQVRAVRCTLRCTLRKRCANAVSRRAAARRLAPP
jgi:hypothetical protein